MSTTFFALGDYAARGSDTGTRLRAATAAAVIGNPLGLLIADRIAREARPPDLGGNDRRQGEDDIYRGQDDQYRGRSDREPGDFDQPGDFDRLTSNEAVMVAALSAAADALTRIATALEGQVENQNQLFERLAMADAATGSTRSRNRRSSAT